VVHFNKKKDNVIIIPIQRINSINHHADWINSYREAKVNRRFFGAKAVKFDFARCRFLKPYHIAPISCLAYEYIEKGYKVKIVNLDQRLSKYLTDIKFLDFCEGKITNGFPKSLDVRALPLWRIDPEEVNTYPNRAQVYFEQNHFDGQSLFSLGNALSELMNNMLDHSSSKIPGVTFTHFDRDKSELITCICDFGLGIPRKVNSFLRHNGDISLKPVEALEKALEKGFSTKTKPHNKGLGWDNIFSQVKTLNGKMLIVSNDALYWLLDDDHGVKTVQLKQNFPGTSVIIWFDTSRFPAIEEDSGEISIF